MLSVLFTQLFFTIDEVKLVPEPIIYILKSQEVTFVKRLDIFFRLYLVIMVHRDNHDFWFII